MKLSVKIQDQQHQHQSHHESHRRSPLLLRAKIPITIFSLPFLSGFSATSTTFTDHSDLSVSLSTHFSSGPSLKLSYNATASAVSKTTSTAPSLAAPLTLTLKSGIGLFGSPNDSPLVMSANFSFSPQNLYPNPTFSLHFKPRLGDFSLRKTTFSNPNPIPSPNPKPNGRGNSFEFMPLDNYPSWKSLALDTGNKDSLFSGFAVTANTSMPVMKRVALNFRWGLNVSADVGEQMPFLTVNKIGIERVDQAKEVKEVKEEGKEGSGGDLEAFKGLFSWMKKELDLLQRENREMKTALDEMKMGRSARHGGGDDEGIRRKSAPVVENSGGFERWKSKKAGGVEKGSKESMKSGKPSDVESELQKAIMAASS